jgi:hypothetical protein
MDNKIFNVGDKVKVVANKMYEAFSYEGASGIIDSVSVNESNGNTLYNVLLDEYNYALYFLGIELELI